MLGINIVDGLYTSRYSTASWLIFNLMKEEKYFENILMGWCFLYFPCDFPSSHYQVLLYHLLNAWSDSHVHQNFLLGLCWETFLPVWILYHTHGMGWDQNKERWYRSKAWCCSKDLIINSKDITWIDGTGMSIIVCCKKKVMRESWVDLSHSRNI